MRVTTVTGTADEDDYQRIRGSQQERLINNNVRRASADVAIKTDNVYESVEEFSLDLFFASPQTGFFVMPNIATVTILDALIDLTIGFTGAPYQAMENKGPMIFAVAVNVIGNAMLYTDVVVSFSTKDGSTSGGIAVAASDYVGQSNVLLTFNAATRSIDVSVNLIDDNVHEGEEDFSGTLTLVTDSQRVAIVQGSAVATIVDDEIIECLPLTSIDSGIIRYAPDTIPNFALGTVATYSCIVGYALDLSVGSRTRTCTKNGMIGEFDGRVPTCVSVCQELAPLVNGRIDYFPDTTAPYLEGTRATHTCNPGFILDGINTRICQNNNFFNGTPPTCEVIECSPLANITNGLITYAPDTTPNYALGTVATYSCNAGYVLDPTIGSETRTCTDNVIGEFDGEAPTCNAVECLELFPLENGVITYSPDTEAPFALGTMADHICNQGYRLVGVQTRVCEDVGTAVGEFSGCPPVCKSQGCPVNTYQGTLSTGENACVPCPANSISTVPNSQSCTCFSGYYRTNEEGPSYGCTAPPSGCRNLHVFEERTRSNTISVRWERPEITGRDDFYYNIFYSVDNQTFTQHNIRPSAKRDLLVDYSLSGLRPLTSYTIRVTAENGVSDQEERGETRSCEVVGRTGDTRPNAPSLVLGLCSVVVWTAPNRAYGRVIGYDLNFVPSGSSNVTVSKGIREMFHIIGENEVPMAIRGSTQVQVRAKVPFADGEWSKLVPVGCTM